MSSDCPVCSNDFCFSFDCFIHSSVAREKWLDSTTREKRQSVERPVEFTVCLRAVGRRCLRPLVQRMKLMKAEQFENAYVTRVTRKIALSLLHRTPMWRQIAAKVIFFHSPAQECLIFKLFVNHLHPSKIDLSTKTKEDIFRIVTTVCSWFR